MISTSTTHVAVRKQGVCRGTLWRQEAPSSSNNKQKKGGAATASSSSSFWSGAEAEYCTVTTNWLHCHESLAALERGDAPVRLYRIVGASAWDNDTGARHAFRLVTNQGTQLYCQAVTAKCRQQWLATLHAGLEWTLLSWSENNNESSPYHSEVSLMKPPPPPTETPQKSSSWRSSKRRHCQSCGAWEDAVSRPLLPQHARPVVQYGWEQRVLLCPDCFVAQGLVDSLHFTASCLASAQQEQDALRQARQLCVQLVTPKKPNSGKNKRRQSQTSRASPNKEEEASAAADAKPKESSSSSLSPAAAAKPSQSAPPNNNNNNNKEEHESSAHDESEAADDDEKVLDPQAPPPASPPPLPPPPPKNPKAADHTDRHSDSSSESWTAVEKPNDGDDDADPKPDSTTTANTPSPQNTTTNNNNTASSSWIHISPTSKSTATLLKALREYQQLKQWRCLSPVLEHLSDDLLQGRIGVGDFLELLDDAVGQGDGLAAQLKKQALRTAGDMGTAMKLLFQNALPPQDDNNNNDTDGDAPSRQATPQTLQCLLEFFLDLCASGELATVAFYWPQLCHLHLCMLPPRSAAAVARVDLVEDFLLTVATQYSVTLALQLAWSHTADLQESLAACWGHASTTSSSSSSAASPTAATSSASSTAGSATNTAAASASAEDPSPACRNRRFAVLRFVCELESLLFGHDADAWGSSVGGAGSVTLGKLLSATPNQWTLLQRALHQIAQLRRATATCPLTHPQAVRQKRHRPKLSDEQLVQEKLRIAKNADYFTSHWNFTKRVCDIAEKLRFTDVRQRAAVLQDELCLLNASGAMGGDPLNRCRVGTASSSSEFVRIVRVPATEGHVFRSKERTPVLLLVEVVDEGAEAAEELPKLCNVARDGDEDDEEDENDKGDVDDDEGKENAVAAAASDDASESNKGTTKAAGNEDLPEIPAALGRPEPLARSPSWDETMAGSPRRGRHARKTSSSSVELEGAQSEGDYAHHHHHGALKRFEGGGAATPNTPKRVVDKMITNVMTEQLNLGSPERKQAHSDRNKRDVSPSPLPPLTHATTATPLPPPSTISPKTTTTTGPRRMFKNSNIASTATADAAELAPTGDSRREVLNVLMMKGRQGQNSIAAGTADAVQRSLRELEAKRATALLNENDKDTEEPPHGSSQHSEDDDDDDPVVVVSSLSSSRGRSREDLPNSSSSSSAEAPLGGAPGTGLSRGLGWEEPVKHSEEDEIMEAVRLLLIQNRVAQGHLSADDAAKVLQHVSLSRVSSAKDVVKAEQQAADPKIRSGGNHHQNNHNNNHIPNDMPTVDAGDLDPRLAGCGPLPPAVLQALTLWKGEMVTNGELLELVKKDIEFVRNAVLLESESVDKLREDSAFWGRFAFGERWAEKKSRIAASSPQGSSHPGWDLVGIIVKSNDDLRQEAFVMQLIELCQEAFEIAGLELWVSPYRILATGRTTGLIEMVRNAMSFDALKKRPGFKGGLREHLQRMTEYTADPGGSFQTAQQNFVRSLAAYSLLSYLFGFKDRHNGNLLLDTAGHVIHIDFGFVFGVAPGGSFSPELSTPFKLTEEMLEVMGGLHSPLFSDFVTLFCCGFLALQAYSDTFVTLVDITSRHSTFKCFAAGDANELVTKLRERFCPDLNQEETIAFALDLIKQATTSYGTRQYDLFQYLTQGIAA